MKWNATGLEVSLSFFFKCHEDVCGSCLQVFSFSNINFFACFAGYSCCIEINISGNVCKSIVDVRLFRSCDLGGVLDERADFAPKFVHLKVLS